jgi:hypothetical protein
VADLIQRNCFGSGGRKVLPVSSAAFVAECKVFFSTSPEGSWTSGIRLGKATSRASSVSDFSRQSITSAVLKLEAPISSSETSSHEFVGDGNDPSLDMSVFVKPLLSGVRTACLDGESSGSHTLFSLHFLAGLRGWSERRRTGVGGFSGTSRNPSLKGQGVVS